MTPKEKANEMLAEYDFTVDNYASMFPREDKGHYINDLKHEVLLDTCIEIIKVCKRLNEFEIPFWKEVHKELNISKDNFKK